jgi:hypothetical protein
MVIRRRRPRKEGFLELPRKGFVGTRWFSDARRMIMDQDQSGSVAFECGLDHLSRVV